MRRLRSASLARVVALALGAGLLAACALDSNGPPPEPVPTSPVGTWVTEDFDLRFERGPDGADRVASSRLLERITITVADDGTLSYAAQRFDGGEPASRGWTGRWRAPTAAEAAGRTRATGKWFVFEAGEPDRPRRLEETSRCILWLRLLAGGPVGPWFFPRLDVATGRLADTYSPVRPAEPGPSASR